MEFDYSIEIRATPERIWEVMADVERWPEWTASMREVRLVEGDRLTVGSRVRVRQPRLPVAVWSVTRVEPARGFTWEAGAPGFRSVADHAITPMAGGAVVTLSIRTRGLMSRLLSPLMSRMTRRYVTMEAEGLKRRSESAA